jgi:hypothetical protein
LLFFDEVQQAPKVILALRYFYEEMPQLHVVAAGSLLEFAIAKVGVSIGKQKTFGVRQSPGIELSIMGLVASIHNLK